MTKRQFGVNFVAIILVLSSTLGQTYAQESPASKPFPSKAVHLVIPFVAGGAIDVIGRLLAERLSAQWKYPVVIENKPGAGGSIGAQYVASGGKISSTG